MKVLYISIGNLYMVDYVCIEYKQTRKGGAKEGLKKEEKDI